MKKLGGAALIAAVLVLAGCAGAPAVEAEETPTATATRTASAAPSARPTTAAPTPTVAAPPADGAYIVDERLTSLQAVTSFVQTLQEPEPGRWVIRTSLVDPRGDDGSSEEAQKALAVCDKAVALGATKVSVMESNDSTFVLYGHPSYGNVCAIP